LWQLLFHRFMNNYHWLPSLQDHYPFLIQSIERFGAGHIHQTFLLATDEGKFILQQFNRSVFKNPDAIAENHQLIANHLQNITLPYTLSFAVPNIHGSHFTTIKESLFRVMPFIDGATFNRIETPEQAFLAAEAFASLIKFCRNVPSQDLKSVIPDFHDLGKRFTQFEQALAENIVTTDEEVEELIAFYLSQKELVQEYNERISNIPLRLTHNDTKINNLIFSKTGDEVKGIVDLDTLMPGHAFYDFGDLVRTAACTLDENSQDWENIQLDLAKYESLKNGFIAGGKGFFTDQEIDSFSFGGKMMTLIIGLRFLTDYLNGNIYYQIHYPEQNLHRAKNQMCLLSSIKAIT
jgi:Ser/Thr protein kinase RdoA (MazF antagonist)